MFLDFPPFLNSQHWAVGCFPAFLPKRLRLMFLAPPSADRSKLPTVEGSVSCCPVGDLPAPSLQMFLQLLLALNHPSKLSGTLITNAPDHPAGRKCGSCRSSPRPQVIPPHSRMEVRGASRAPHGGHRFPFHVLAPPVPRHPSWKGTHTGPKGSWSCLCRRSVGAAGF